MLHDKMKYNFRKGENVKRVLAFVMSCFILVLSCPVFVFADDSTGDDDYFYSNYFDEDGNLNLQKYLDYYAYMNEHSGNNGVEKSLGLFKYACLRSGVSSLEHYGNLLSGFANFCTGDLYKDYIVGNVKVENSKRRFTFTDKFMSDLQSYLHNYIETNEGYYWSRYIDRSALPKNITAGAYDYNKSNYANNAFVNDFNNGAYDEMYTEFLNHLDNAFVTVYTPTSSSKEPCISKFSYYVADSPVYLVSIDNKLDGRALSYILKNDKLVRNGPDITGSRQYDYGVNFYYDSDSSYKTRVSVSSGSSIICFGYNSMYEQYQIDYFVGAPHKIFNTLADLYNYLQGNSKVYTYSPFNKRQTPSGNDTPFDLDKLLNIDWSTILADLSATINNNINLDDLEISFQNTIDAAFDDVLGVLNDVKNEQIDQGQTLDQILANINAQGSNQSSWLAKIYLLLDARLPIKSSDNTDNPGTGGNTGTGSGGDSGGGSSGADYTDYLEKIITLLDENGETLEDIKKNTSKLVALLAVDTGLNFFDVLSAKLAASNDTLKNKFPTSIPWDLVAIFNLFKAEPEAPVFDLPIEVQSIGVKENIHIDLSESSATSNMSTVSKISRSMLTATFILFLVVLTRNLFGGDK